jgi:hypothetical protein
VQILGKPATLTGIRGPPTIVLLFVMLLTLPRIPADPIVTGIAVGVFVVGLVAWLIVNARKWNR